jgi:4-alpha-glucanotransferase
MSEALQALLDQLASHRGLGEAYYDHQGQLRYFSRDARRAILYAMGEKVDDEAALRSALETERIDSVDGKPGPKCFEPTVLSQGKCWGLSVQLYTLRSARNWGIGDLGDLRELIELTAPLGCDVIGLNPLHALFGADPAHCSPYSPSSRMFLNGLYVSVEHVPEFKDCASLQSLYAQQAFQSALRGLRATPVVMYESAAALKKSALRLLYEHFCIHHLRLNTARAKLFGEFVHTGGWSLRAHAIFEALDQHFRLQSPPLCGWQNWPLPYQDPQSEAVQEFAAANRYEVEFHIYVQWLADSQLAQAQQLAKSAGMRIGLYGDLAVGSNPSGSEVWSNPALYVTGAAIGAPPDPLALSGQDWGIPPVAPHALRVQGFKPLIDLLNANMRQVGALRIDHVMSLFRLWWVPKGFSATEGVYVHYPLTEQVQRLAQLSEQHRCLIIGEDLGTVPDEMRHAMSTYRLYHYKVLLFEKNGDRFKHPQEYVREAVATATTHDLPPLKAWWQADDLQLRDALKLYPTPETADQLRAERESDRAALLRALRDQQLWHWADGDVIPEFSPPLARAVHMFLGMTNAALVLLQLEDLIGMTDPVNVPGTHVEHANWQRKVSVETAELFKMPYVRETLAALGRARAGQHPNRD